jgi:hypothetical protein
MPELTLHPGDIGPITQELLRGARSPDKFSPEPRRIATRGSSHGMREASTSISAASSLERMIVKPMAAAIPLQLLTANA